MTKEKKNPRHPTSRSDDPTWFDKLSMERKDLFCAAILYALVLALFHGIVFNNMVFTTEGDTAAALSSSHAGKHLEETEHIEPLWTPYIFSGMPSFGSLAYTPRSVSYLQRVIHLTARILFLNADMGWFVMHYFLAGLFMFLLSRVWKFSHIASLIAAVTFMVCPYAVGLTVTGHGSKMMALSYIPLLFLLTHQLLQQRNFLNFGLLIAAIGTQFLTNHVQMVYYSMMLIGGYVLYRLIGEIKEHKLQAVKSAGVFAAAIALGFAIAAYVYLPVHEYAQYSIRGGGEAGSPGGLNYGYATNWSFHPFEVLTYLVPGFFGSTFPSSLYWGWMPFNDTTVYIGIVPIILGIFALVYNRQRETLFLAFFSLFILMISFGKHFAVLYDLLFNYLPYFDKFRAPSMILHLMPFSFGLLAAYGFTAMTDVRSRFKELDTVKLRKRLTIALSIIGGLFIIGLLAKSTVYSAMSGFMFQRDGDLQELQQYYGAQAQRVLPQMRSARFDILWTDYIKFALIACASLGLIIVFLKNKLKATTLGFGLTAILAIDLFIIDSRFIDPRPRTDVEKKFTPDATVQLLRSDTTLYRIFPTDRFQDNTWMYYFIQSVGGYSPAKLRIYQELLDSCVYSHGSKNVINMLNVKYIVGQQRMKDGTVQSIPQLNPDYLPRAWFVDSVIVAERKTVVFYLLNSSGFDPGTTAILEKHPPTKVAKSESTAVRMTSFGAHKIVLNTYCSNPSLLVLSEVYYPAGWKAFIDGTETEILKTNYVLRSVTIPPGAHTVEFIFDPPIYEAGKNITYAAWGITALLVVIGFIQRWRLRTPAAAQQSDGESGKERMK